MARYNELFVKVFKGERELALVLMVDVSGSELFSTQQQFKSEITTEATATLAFLVLQNNDKVDLILLSGQIELSMSPKKGKSHVLYIIRELTKFKPKGLKTDIGKASRFLSRVMKKETIVFIFPDFIDKGYERPIQVTAKKHDITSIRIYNQEETESPNLDYITVKDAEAGGLMRIDAASSAMRRGYAQQYHGMVSCFEGLWQKPGTGVTDCCNNENYTQKLSGYSRRR